MSGIRILANKSRSDPPPAVEMKLVSIVRAPSLMAPTRELTNTCPLTCNFSRGLSVPIPSLPLPVTSAGPGSSPSDSKIARSPHYWRYRERHFRYFFRLAQIPAPPGPELYQPHTCPVSALPITADAATGVMADPHPPWPKCGLWST